MTSSHPERQQSVIFDGQRVAIRSEGQGPVLVIFDPRGEQWCGALGQHYQVVRFEPEGIERDGVICVDRVIGAMRMLGFHNPHLLVGGDHLALAVELLTRPQEFISWRSATIVTTTKPFAALKEGRLARWLMTMLCGMTQQPSGSEPSSDEHAWQRERLFRLQRAMARNAIPCRIVESGDAAMDSPMWQLFDDVERVRVAGCPRALVQHLAEALAAFHERLRQARRGVVGL